MKIEQVEIILRGDAENSVFIKALEFAEINQTIAEITGVYQPDHIGGLYHTAHGWVRDCPDYCTDLNAMHEAEKHIELEAWPEYINTLLRISDEAVHASARQRAEAFLRFYGKW